MIAFICFFYPQVFISFLEFELEANYDCRYDWMKVYPQGADANSALSFCGSTPSASMSSGSSNVLIVQFHSDFSIQKSGFKFAFAHNAPPAEVVDRKCPTFKKRNRNIMVCKNIIILK